MRQKCCNAIGLENGLDEAVFQQVSPNFLTKYRETSAAISSGVVQNK